MNAVDTMTASFGWIERRVRARVRYTLDHWIASRGCYCDACNYRRAKH